MVLSPITAAGTCLNPENDEGEVASHLPFRSELDLLRASLELDPPGLWDTGGGLFV
jgi:hypothetical protein